jgi:hypothetical protein
MPANPRMHPGVRRFWPGPWDGPTPITDSCPANRRECRGQRAEGSSLGWSQYYGDAMLDDRGLTRFLARCLLFAPVIDRAWVGHQLLESACALRISAKPSGVVARIE